MVIQIAAAAKRIIDLKRRCPKCRRDQIVPGSKKHEKVTCKFCGAAIPAAKG